MLLTLRRYLLVLLGLLQFVAPLVHAHSGNGFAQFGLHLPNFEIYTVATQQNTPALQSFDALAHLNEAIVGISAGIQNHPNSIDDLSSPLYFLPTPFVFSLTLVSCEINFSPQSLQNLTTLVHSLQSPRAPPV